MCGNVSPEDFINWLTTQINSHGTLYLERVARQYARYLKVTPSKLDINLSADERNVFNCTTVENFKRMQNTFVSASNYRTINENSHQTFSAGLKCYLRYLSFLEGEDGLEYVRKSEGRLMDVSLKEDMESSNFDILRVDFSNTQECTGSNPVSCKICGNQVPLEKQSWGRLLVAVVEYFISNNNSKIDLLCSRSLANRDEAFPFILDNKIDRYICVQLSNGKWINLNYATHVLVSRVANLCRFCEVNLNEVEIYYTPKKGNGNNYLNVENSHNTASTYSDTQIEIPCSIIEILTNNYSNGFNFNATTVRLLADKAGIDIDNKIQSSLKSKMFRRGDGLHFLLDIVADEATREDIVNFADSFLSDFGCFEISELYSLFSESLNDKCIGGIEDFEAFYEFLNRNGIRCVGQHGTRIARIQNRNIRDLFSDIAGKVIDIAHNEFGGTVSEDDIRYHFSAFSLSLLSNIIKEYAEELVKIEINGIVCYQTLDALGLSDDFTEILTDVLERIEELGLTPSEEVLHTALSLQMGVNFKTEYNIPDDKTYRRLIAVYYKSEPKREWKYGRFTEASI